MMDDLMAGYFIVESGIERDELVDDLKHRAFSGEDPDDLFDEVSDELSRLTSADRAYVMREVRRCAR